MATIGQWLGSYPRLRATETPPAKRSKGQKVSPCLGWHLLGPERVGAKRARSQKVRLEQIPRPLTSKRNIVVRLTCDSVGIGSCHTCPPHARSPRSARLKTASSRFNPHSDRVKLKPSGGTFLGRHVNSRIGFVCPH